jgi:hypothetical protein
MGYFENYNESSRNAFTRAVTPTLERFFETEILLTLQMYWLIYGPPC